MYHRLDKELSVAPLHGIFRRRISLFQAIALITSGTIGAGILGMPYAIARIGVPLGVAYIIGIGFLMMAMNLLVGEIAARTGVEAQLPGLAKRYLGVWGERAMTLLGYTLLFGVLVVYIIGEGESLSALLGGSSFQWSIIFFIIASILVTVGMRTVKVVEFFLSLGILAIVLIIALLSAPYIELPHVTYFDFADILFPYGVILFAFYGTSAIPEAHALLKNRDVDFKKAIVIASLVVMAVYLLFSLVTIWVTGPATTEIATIGLGEELGSIVHVLGNLFAIFAMGTGFLMAGLALRDSLRWDYKVSPVVSSAIVCGVPFIVFILGLRSFIIAIDIMGGVFISIEMLLTLLIYWKAKKSGMLIKKSGYKLRHSVPLIAILVVALLAGSVYSVIKLF